MMDKLVVETVEEEQTDDNSSTAVSDDDDDNNNNDDTKLILTSDPVTEPAIDSPKYDLMADAPDPE